MTIWTPTKEIWTPNLTAHDILDVFKEEKTPLDAFVRLHKISLPWIIEKIFVNQSGAPLRLLPFQCVLLQGLWNYKFPMIISPRGSSKTFLFGLYALVRAILCRGSQIIIVGASFRQSKMVFNYISKLYYQSPIIQEALKPFGGPKLGSDTAYIDVGRLSTIKAIPIGDGETIRGIRSTNTLVDEFSSVPEEIFETVISPFASVHQDPEEQVRVKSFCNRLKKIGIPNHIIDHILTNQGFGNQIAVGGTASYQFNHFYKQFVLYKTIIESGGDVNRVKQAIEARTMSEEGRKTNLTQDELINLSKNWKNYFIFKLPYQGMPDGFLDRQIVESNKAKFSRTRFSMEYEAEFAKDSEGFIKRSWIEEAISKDHYVELFGDPRSIYVMGLDPARWNDNFGCVIMKVTPSALIPVYCTAWNRTDAALSIKKIRSIYKRFPIRYIAMDSGGGGDGIADLLCLKELIKDPEDVPIWRIPEQIENKSDTGAPGPKILEMINWSSQWIAQAAHALEADISHKRIQFVHDANIDKVFDQFIARYPHIEGITDKEKILIEQELYGREDDDYNKLEEGVWDNLQEMINETCAIERRVTPNGVEQFELPRLTEQPEGLDIRRRDRFSALVLAAYAARVYQGTGHKPNLNVNVMGSPDRIFHSSKTRGKARRRGSALY